MKYLNYDIVDIPDEGVYIPIRVYGWEKTGKNSWRFYDRTMAILPDVNITKNSVCKIADNIYAYAIVKPPIDLSGGIIYKMSELFPDTYATASSLAESTYDFSQLKTTAEMYKGCKNITSPNLYNISENKKCSGVLDFHSMFEGCENLGRICIDMSGLSNANYTIDKYKERLKDMFKGARINMGLILENVSDTLRQALTKEVLSEGKAFVIVPEDGFKPTVMINNEYVEDLY